MPTTEIAILFDETLGRPGGPALQRAAGCATAAALAFPPESRLVRRTPDMRRFLITGEQLAALAARCSRQAERG
ncbi:MAG TPA: hypothetical protein VMU66_00205 [Gaiellales bacterium]|nr:hypothetical protein [Gaiellales bacterium]